jgi:hypothetical protein
MAISTAIMIVSADGLALCGQQRRAGDRREKDERNGEALHDGGGEHVTSPVVLVGRLHAPNVFRDDCIDCFGADARWRTGRGRVAKAAI